jgi:trimethylamine--corrinoid protein Co-methyltransferase
LLFNSAPEAAMLMAGLAQLGKDVYGLAPQGNGLCTDGFSYPHTLFQKAQNMLMLGLAGGKMMIGAGEVEGVVSCDPVQLVIDDEIMAITRRLLRPIMVNEDTLALDEIERVGPRGQFLDSDHTFRHHRAGELLHTKLFERGSRNSWLAEGAESLVDKAREKARRILATHQVPPLEERVSRELHAIVRKADEELY